MKATEVRPSTIVRNCFRCGAEFESGGGNRICPACRPNEERKKVLNPNLSFREEQVVSLVCQAKLNKEIAYELHLSEGTIKEYLNRIYRKLGVGNRTELAVWAMTRTYDASKNASLGSGTGRVPDRYVSSDFAGAESAA